MASVACCLVHFSKLSWTRSRSADTPWRVGNGRAITSSRAITKRYPMRTGVFQERLTPTLGTHNEQVAASLNTGGISIDVDYLATTVTYDLRNTLLTCN